MTETDAGGSKYTYLGEVKDWEGDDDERKVLVFADQARPQKDPIVFRKWSTEVADALRQSHERREGLVDEAGGHRRLLLSIAGRHYTR